MELNEISTVKLTSNGYIVNNGAFVPFAPGNKDYRVVLDWIALGNAPAPADPPEPVVPPVWEDLARVILESPVSLPPQASQKAKAALARLQNMIGGN